MSILTAWSAWRARSNLKAAKKVVDTMREELPISKAEYDDCVEVLLEGFPLIGKRRSIKIFKSVWKTIEKKYQE